MESLSAKITRNPVILEQIFNHLPPSDIKTVALVNRTWNSVVEQPRYWTWLEADIDVTNFNQIFISRKFGWISSLRVGFLSSGQIRAILDHIVESKDMKLKKLDLTWQEDLPEVDSNILSDAVVRLEEVDFDICKLSPVQVESIFRAVVKCQIIKLKKLNMRINILHSVSDECMNILIQAVAILESMNFDSKYKAQAFPSDEALLILPIARD